MNEDAKPPVEIECSCSECCGNTADKDSEGNVATYVKETPDWVVERLPTAGGSFPLVSTRLSWRDRLGFLKVRLGIGRMHYAIKPGLYGVGNPGSDSSVFVSANYKMSFDKLRKELCGLDAWVLVLDTKGINVWCAAGKGTFGTEEIVRRVGETGLARIVSHRTIVLPQLGAPGVAAHEVKKRCGFKVVYGPVRAADIKSFLAAGLKAAPEMRLVRFAIADRIVLSALDLISPVKYGFLVLAAVVILDLLGLDLFSWKAVYAYLGAIISGGFLVPALLPWIPGRPFAFKGWLLGMVWALIVNLHQGLILTGSPRWGLAAAYFLLLPAISAFIAMGFTGSSTYTSLSGVVKEMKYAVPAIIVSAGMGLAFLVAVLVRIL